MLLIKKNLTTLIVFLTVFGAYSQKTEKSALKSYLKSDAYFVSGEYKKAIKSNQKLENKIKKYSKTEKTPYSAWTQIKNVRYNEGYGIFTDMDSLISVSLDEASSYSSGPLVKAKILLDVVNTYYSYGNIKKADEYLSDIESIDNLDYEPDFYSQILVKRIQLDLKNGDFDFVVQKAPDALAHIEKTFSKKYESKSIIDGVEVQRKRSGKDIAKNQMLYADVLNAVSGSHVYSGNYLAADTSLENTTRWIKKEGLGKSSISYVNTLLIYTDYYTDINDIKESRKSLEKALTISEKSKGYKLKPYSKDYISMYEKLNSKLLALDEGNNFRKTKSEIEPLISRYYSRKSFPMYRLKLLETQKDYYKQNYEKGLKDIIDLLDKRSSYIPSDHPIITEYYESYLDKYQYIENKNFYNDIRKEYQESFNKLYSKEKPIYAYTQVKEAVHKIHNRNEYDEAEELYQENFDKVVSKKWHPMYKDYQTWVNTRSYGFINKDKYTKAETLLVEYDKDIDTYYGKNSLQKAISLQQIGDLNISKGNYDVASTKLTDAVEVYDEIKETKNINYMYTLKSRARLKMVQGDYDKAEKELDKALKVAKKNDLESEFNIEEFASLYIKQGKYHKVGRLLNTSLETKNKKYGDAHQSLIDTYRLLGELDVISGNYTQGEKNLHKSEEICVNILGRESMKFTEVEETHATLYEAIGDYENAEFSYRDILEIKESVLGREHVSVAKTLNSLALAEYLNKKGNDEVEHDFNESLQIIEKKIGVSNPTYAEVLTDKASYYIAVNRLDEGDQLLKQADSIWETNSDLGKNNVHSAEITMQRSSIARKKQNYDKSLDMYEDAVKMYRKIFSDRHPDYVYALSKTAQLRYIIGDVLEANNILEETTRKYLTFITKYFPSLSEREKSKYWARIKDDFEFYNTVAFSNEKSNPSMISQVYNNVLATKAILLSSSIKIRKSIQSSGDTSLIASYNDWVTKREYLTSIAGLSDEQLKSQGIDFGLLEKEIEGLEKYLSENSDVFRKGNKRNLIDWRTIKEQLVENEYAVEVIRYRYFDKDFSDSIVYAALVVSPKTKRAPEVIHFPSGNKFETKYIKYYRNSIKFRVEDKWSYGALWKPFEKKIPSGAKVYFSPEGVYNQLNLEAIRTGDDKYALDRNEIVLVSNTKDLLERKLHSENNSKEKTAVLMGNPAFYDIRAQKDSIIITIEDSLYANEYDHIYVSKDDDIIATYKDGVRIFERDNVIAVEEDQIYIKSEDNIYAHAQDKIYITEEDSVVKFDKVITIEDSIIASMSDQVFISNSDSVVAEKYHALVIKDSDDIWAEARHNKLITELDSVYARDEHRIFITESDNIINHSIYDRLTVSQLPGAESEIKSLSKLLKKNKWKIEDYVFEDATEDTVKTFKSPKVFHIATHGFFVGNAKQKEGIEGLHEVVTAKNPLLKSGLILQHGGDIVDKSNVFDYNLEPGILTAYEAMSLNFDNTELVVLSACETGLGEVQVGEGVYGLQRSFLVAGAQSVIMSLFKVSDEATLKLMNLFYKNWIDGMDKRTAFIKAKKELRKEYKDPIYWGAFIMVGV